jgi:uncharacterized membrane protein YdjX (TVP38/TMEM64 family)
MRLVAFFRTRSRTIPATWVAAALWCSLIAAIYWYYHNEDVSLRQLLFSLFTFLSTDPRAPFLYILVYTLQPFAFMPSTVFTILAGSIFGFWPALFYTIIGANLSATAVYWTGRAIAQPAPGLLSRLGNWLEALTRAPFQTVLLLRLAYAPFDLVNFVSGILTLRYWSFVIATALGSLPAIATITSLGTAIDLDSFLTHGITTNIIDPHMLLLSLGLFVVSLLGLEGIRRLLRHRTQA